MGLVYEECRAVRGDGLLLYFGIPHAHEDDAQRAVSAGLFIYEDIGIHQLRGVAKAMLRELGDRSVCPG
jgi:hypothetical protein